MSGSHPRTAIEKIVGRHVVGWSVGRPPATGDYVTVRPAHVMTHDNTSAVIPKFEEITRSAGVEGRVFDPRQPVFAMDHDIQNHSPENLGKYAKIRSFAARQGVRFYPPGRGIAHQVMMEEGYVRPGSMVVGSDSHSNVYGALGCVGTPVVRTDAAAIWASGEVWWLVPPMVRCVLRGCLPRGATGKDVIVTLCAVAGGDEVLNTAVEFVGEGVRTLSVEERMTIANMSTEWGALVALFPFDEALRSWLLDRARALSERGTSGFTLRDVERWWEERSELISDDGARFVREIEVDLSTLSPHVSGPNSVNVATGARALEARRVAIDKAYLMSCVNARLSDLEAAASVFAGDGGGGPGRRVADGVEFFVAAASDEVERSAAASGAWGRLMEAGAIALPAGCGACIGLGRGTLEPGEVGISATNRNFEGRMGSREASCYLASPAVVAESAIRGYIAAPRGGLDAGETAAPRVDVRDLSRRGVDRERAEAADLVEGFPEIVRGRSVLLTRDAINTDGIYGKDVTYRDDITFEGQGEHAMRNYDPSFGELSRAGDVLVTGRRFGTGSSREQAATCLLSRGIRVVVAASVNQTYLRNALNNGLIVIECPAVFESLRRRMIAAGSEPPRTVVGPELSVRFAESVIEIAGSGERFGFRSLTGASQRLIKAGGLEALVAGRLRDRVRARAGAPA